MPDDLTADYPTARINLAREPDFALGSLRLEPALRRAQGSDGVEEILQPLVMQALVALARAEGQIVTRDQLLAACWAGVVVGEDAIDRVIGRIRRLAEGLGGGSFRLETITKVGYRLTSERGRAGPPGGAVPQSAAPPADTHVGAQPGHASSIVVLPFANMSDDPQQSYFSDGITEDIITDLSRVKTLFVVARTTAFTFRDQAVDVPGIARQLGVGHVLEGSVRKSGGRVRITAQLIDGATGGHLWAERYDRDLADIFALQDEISEAIVQALKLNLLPEERRAIEKRRTSSPAAYDLYLMARRYYIGGLENEVSRVESIERLCRRAVELDPGFADAWALLATVQTALCFNFDRPGDAGAAAVARALDLDPGLAEARAVRARHLSKERRNDEAMTEIRLALELNPDSWVANTQAARLHYIAHRFRDAAAFWEKAISLEESSPGDAGMLLSCYHALGDKEGVRRAATIAAERAAAALAANYVNMAALNCGVAAFAALGQTQRAYDLVEQALLIDPDNMRMRYNFACGINCHVGDRDLVVRLLEPMFERAGMDQLLYSMNDPDFDDVRDDPRYQAMERAAVERLAAAGQPLPDPPLASMYCHG